MKIGEIREICEHESRQEMSGAICEQISRIDERMIYDADRNILNFNREKKSVAEC